MSVKKISRNTFPYNFVFEEEKGSDESEQIYICGSSPELGSFDTSKAITMNKISFGRWSVDVRLSIGKHAFKYFKKHPVRGIIWEGGATRIIEENGSPRLLMPIRQDFWQSGASIPPVLEPVAKPTSIQIPSSKTEIKVDKIVPLSQADKEKLLKKKEQKKKKKARYLENKKKALIAKHKESMMCFYCKKTGHGIANCPGLVLKQKNLKERTERKKKEKSMRDAVKENREAVEIAISESWKVLNASQYERKFKSTLRYKSYDIRKNKRQKSGGRENRDNTRKKSQYLSPRLFMAL